jgi:integrase
MARVRLKYICQFRNKVRADKRLRYYFRVRGQKAIPLPGLPGSEAFMKAYGEALAEITVKTKAEIKSSIQIGASETAPGSVDALIVSYYTSSGWLVLGDDTRDSRRRIIEKFRLKHGRKIVAKLEQKHLVEIMGKIASLSARGAWLKAVRHLLQHAVPALIERNPTDGIPQIRLPKTKGHHSWTDQEIALFRQCWKLGSKQRLVFEFCLETVSRRGEVVRLGPQHCYIGDEGERRIRIERTHGSEDVDIPMSDALAAAIDAMPLRTSINGIVPLTFLATERGQERSKKALGNDFAGWAKQAGLPDRCRLHGLKKGGMRRGAEAGLTTHELMGRSGHKSLAEVQRYTAAANQKKLANSGAVKLAAAAAKGPKLITKKTGTDQE